MAYKKGVNLDTKQEIIRLYQQGVSYRDIADTLNQNLNTDYWDGERVRNIIRRWRKKNNIVSANPQNVPAMSELQKIQIERQKMRDEKSQLSKLLRDYSRIELMGEYIHNAVNKLSPLDIAPLSSVNIDCKSELIVLFSDSQVGERVVGEELGGLNEYDVDVFKSRTNEYFSKVAYIARHEGIRTINIFMLGDILDGINVYKGQRPYLSEEVIDQLIIAAEYLSQVFYNLSQNFSIKLYGVIGNHGRVSYDQALDSTNYEYLLYRYIAERLKGVPFEFGKSFIMPVEIMGHRYVLVHGDYMNNKENSLTRLYGLYPNTDMFVLGHWHVSEMKDVNNFEYVVNGCLVGGNMYSVKRFQSMVKPSQTCFVVTPEYPKWATYKVSLE